jgi:signal transduction histidine kinase
VADIQALVDNVRAGGVSVTLEDDDGWGSASPAVQLCAYRLAQEGLTNAVRHAAGAPVTIRLTTTGEVGVVSVRTAGPVAPGPTPTGRGIPGLATRVAAVSGEFWSGPTPQGWLIEARLPLHAGSGREMTA